MEDYYAYMLNYSRCFTDHRRNMDVFNTTNYIECGDGVLVAGLQGIQIIPRCQFRLGAGFFHFLRGFLRVLQCLFLGGLCGGVILRRLRDLLGLFLFFLGELLLLL